MITPEQIYAATDAGMDILELHITGARSAATHKTGVRLRDESTPSAFIKMRRDGRCYGVTDFGDDGRMKDPIQIHMEATGLTFPEAILDLAGRFGIDDSLSKAVNKPDIRQEPAPADRADGDQFFELMDDFTDSMCRVMGPKVTREDLRTLHWLPVKFIARVKDGKVTYRYSNERFPIFMRECRYIDKDGKEDCFYKIYEPLNPDKGFRFSYMPRGKKQPDYINGLWELRDAYRRLNEKAEAEWVKDPANEGRPYREQKLPEAAICSGERDSLCARSQGMPPLWLNSETAELKPSEYREIMRYVETLYNIPDIDTTGIRRGTALDLKYPDIRTVWLPQEYLSQYRDNRGKTRKDLRDWMELCPDKDDFKRLVERAVPAKFWTVTTEVAKDGGKVRHKYSLDLTCLEAFLTLNGFYRLDDETRKDTQFIRITGNRVKTIRPVDIRVFLKEWAAQEALPRELRNLIALSPIINASNMEALKTFEPNFSSATETSQWFYFPRVAVKVTAEGMKEVSSIKADRHVWDKNVIPHDLRRLPDMFTITHRDGHNASEDFDIEVHPNGSNYFKYLINSSRIYWRKELESNLTMMEPDQRAAYLAAHRFDIAGEGLTEDEIAEQKQCLINKIFTIGYMMHRFKMRSRPWAPFVMDNVIGANGQCNGGSGKSFMFVALSKFTNFVPLPGRNSKLFENQFWAERINRNTDIALFDDIDEYFPVKQLYDTISGDMTINPKNNSSYTLAYEEGPKFAFTTNYTPKEFNGSTVRRMIYVVVSDYYHQRGEETDYLETRSIRDDFGKDLFDATYSEEDWNADINFIMQCVRFYLSVAPLNIKIEPRMGNVIYRKYLRDMSDNFRDWAEQYFAQEGDKLDRMVVRQEAFEDYKRFSGAAKTTMQSFTRSLRGFCYTCNYIDCLNPEDLLNGSGRILKRVESSDGKTRPTDMIYLRTVREAKEMERNRQIAAAQPADIFASEHTTPEDQPMPF